MSLRGTAVQITAAHPEIWLVQFGGNTGGGVGTAAVKQYGTVYRTQGGASVATGTLPFTLSKNETGRIIDIYLSAAVSNSGDFQFDVEISNKSQALFWDATTMLYSANSRPRLPAPGINLPGFTQIAFAAYWITAQSTATTTNLFISTLVYPSR